MPFGVFKQPLINFKMKKIKISNRIIGEGEKPFIIAEMSGNHNQSLDRALQIVEAAAEVGADAIKLHLGRQGIT